jgi:hypothetical protein
MFILERLTQRFENVSLEFWQLIKEEDAVRGERDFARAEKRAAAKNASARSAVVRRAERPNARKIILWAQQAI